MTSGDLSRSRKASAEEVSEKIEALSNSFKETEIENRELLLEAFGRKKPAVFGGGEVVFENTSPEVQKRRIAALDFVCRLGNPEAIARPKLRFICLDDGDKKKEGLCRLIQIDRSHSRHLNEIYVKSISPTGTYVHELAHAIENSNGGIKFLMDNFAKKRLSCAGETLADLAVSYGFERHPQYPNAFRDPRDPGGSYYLLPDSDKVAPDHYFDPYAGTKYMKTWNDTHKSIGPSRSAELFSTGLSELYDNPGRFWRTDPEYFKLVLLAITGVSDLYE